MNKLLLLLIAIPLLGYSQETKEQSTRKVVMILVDGIPTDILYKANTPFMDAMAEAGGFSEAYVGGTRRHITQTPTISAVGYNSMLTGTWVNKHNVFGNSIKNPNYNYPTIFRLLKNADPDKKTAIYSTWLDNRTKLLGENLEATGKLKVDYHLDGLELDEENYPHDPGKKYLKRIDAEVVRKAANDIIEKGPDLTWVYLEHTDDMGHMYGESKELYEGISYEDALIGTIWDAVKLREEETGEDWLILITTDHGRDPINAKHHGGQSYRERTTWMLMSKPVANDYFRNQKVAIVDMLPTIADYMEIPIPKSTAYELDGVSMMKKVDVFQLSGVSIDRKHLHLKWSSENPSAKEARVWVSYTNNYKNGGTDNYQLLGKVPAEQREFSSRIKPLKGSEYAKIVIETDNNTATTWVKL